jgi:hypothetical protein
MKRLFPAFAVLLFLTAAAPVFAIDTPDADGRAERRDRTTVIDDVIRMTQAGVSDDAIIKFVRASRDSYIVDADVIIALTNAKVSKAVLDEIMDSAYARDTDRRERAEPRERAESTTNVIVRPYYDPWYYPYYDPFWWGPRLSVSVGFGRWGHSRGYHGGGGHSGGGHRGGGGGGRGHGRH